MEEVQPSNQSQHIFGDFTANVQGAGNATVNVTLPPLTKQWLKPTRPTLSKPFVGRQALVDTLSADLRSGMNMSITGKALQGMGGIGKTYLALKLAIELYDLFPGGIIRIDVGPQVTDEITAQFPLSRLASYAFGGIPPLGQLQPEQVAAWLSETSPGSFLVIFDDLWHPVPLRLLNRSLPPNAVQLVTTRFTSVAQAIGSTIVPLDRLSLADSLALLEERLHCQNNTTYQPLLENLVKLLGGHALALEIAAAQIKKPSRLQTVYHELMQGIGQGKLISLKLSPGDERDENLERSFALSYDRLTAEQQHKFRTLGVFAEESMITADIAAAIWGMEDVNTAQMALFELADRALLTETEEETTGATLFRQHGLLRVYARALLEKGKELEKTSRTHAQYCTDISWQIRSTSPGNRNLLDQYMLNLLAALQWTEQNDLSLFSSLIDALSDFLLVRGQAALLEMYLPKAIMAAHSINNKVREANLLQSLGDLESRLGNIDQARAHYDAALPLYRAERARLGEANVYMSLGDMFITQEMWADARTYYEKALPLYTIERDPLGLANTLIDLGRARFELGNHEQGMKDEQRAAELFRHIQNHTWAERAEYYLSEMLQKLKQR